MKAIYQRETEIERKQIDIFFHFNGVVVETIKINEIEGKEVTQITTTLQISVELDLEDYESLTDCQIKARPKLLTTLGILSFIANDAFDVFGNKLKSSVEPNGVTDLIQSKKTHLIIDDNNVTQDLHDLLQAIDKQNQAEKDLTYSLFDRWRKGRYLENENLVSLVHHDEIILSYFHVLELLSTSYKGDLLNDAEQLVKDFAINFSKTILGISEPKRLDEEVTLKSKLLNEFLIRDLPLSGQLIYMLKRLNLLNDNNSFLVRHLIELRNAVAHGRQVYHDKAIYPVQPFFPLASKGIYPLETFRIFTARVLAAHLNVDFFHSEWEDLQENLIPSHSFARKFLKDSAFIGVTSFEGLETDVRNLVLGGINHYIINGKIKIKLALSFYEHILNHPFVTDNFLTTNIDGIVLAFP